MNKNLTLRFTLQQIGFWASAAGVMSFASAYLLEKGFAESQVGILLACGNLLSCTVQPILAARADRVGSQVVNRYIGALSALCMLCFVSLLLLPAGGFLFGLMYLMGIFFFDAMLPLLNAVCVAYREDGWTINYGLGRGIGSLAFSLAALGIGELIAAFGGDWMILIVLLLLAFTVVVTLGYPRLENAKAAERKKDESCSIPVFFSRYRWYCVSLLGVMLLAMFHAMTENYLIRVMGRLGGDSGSVGVALFIATMIEMPVLFIFDWLRRHMSDTLLLKLAGLSFLLKSLLFFIAPSVEAIYFIQLLQATSYTFLSPTQMFYASARVSASDMVKGQAFITASYTLGCAIGNFIGGQILQYSDVPAMLLAGIVMAAFGTLIIFLTVNKKDRIISET